MKWARRLLALVILGLLLYVGWRFASDNAAPVAVSYVLGVLEPVPVWMALLAAFGCGAGVVGAIAVYELSKARLLSRRYRKRLAVLEA